MKEEKETVQQARVYLRKSYDDKQTDLDESPQEYGMVK